MTQNVFFCISAFLRFCKKNHENSKKENLDFLRANGIAFVDKFENPSNAPQIRPIEDYWGILKMKLEGQNQGSFNSTHQNETKRN